MHTTHDPYPHAVTPDRGKDRRNSLFKTSDARPWLPGKGTAAGMSGRETKRKQMLRQIPGRLLKHLGVTLQMPAKSGDPYMCGSRGTYNGGVSCDRNCRSAPDEKASGCRERDVYCAALWIFFASVMHPCQTLSLTRHTLQRVLKIFSIKNAARQPRSKLIIATPSGVSSNSKFSFWLLVCG